MEVACQRCQSEEGVLAEFKVREFTAAGTIRWWYLCPVHLEEDFGPWLKAREYAQKTARNA